MVFDTIERVKRIEIKSRAKNFDKANIPAKSKVIVVHHTFLPEWPEQRLAAPNIIFRTALFPALNNRQPRRNLVEEKLFSVAGIDVIFTGTQFNQTDLDVYLEILNIAKKTPLGSPIRFSAHSMLKALGRQTGKSQHKWLHSVLIRLRGGTVDMTDKNKRFFGGLIESGFKDEITKQYAINLNPKFAELFGFGMWATIDRDQRYALGNNSVAKALHAYYSSHTIPMPHRFDTLAGIAGLTNKNKRDIKAIIIKAHEDLKKINFLADYISYTETIEVSINMTPGQVRHVIRKTRK